MNAQVLLIPKIENGIVIDHIPVGLGVRILEIIRAHPGLDQVVVTLGLNYDSPRMGRKDIVKLSVRELPERVLEHISVVSPGATIKRITEFQVDKKYTSVAPRLLVDLARCRNPGCITNTERDVHSRFEATEGDPQRYRCAFCERVFDVSELEFTFP